MSSSKYALFVCDLQSRFRPIIHAFPTVLRSANTFIKIASIVDMPIYVTEQNPAKLGATCEEITESLKESKTTQVVAKMRFSMVDSSALTFLEGRTSVILCGIETHVCIQQTAFDLLARGLNVIIPVEAVSSQRVEDRNASLRLLLARGATITTVESAVMTMLETADHPSFRQVMKVMLAHTNAMIELPKLE